MSSDLLFFMERIADSIWVISHNSNIYFLDLEKKMVIDAGDRSFRDKVISDFSRLCDPKEVEIVVFTHLHYDHIGNFDLFPNAEFYASAEAIEDKKNDSVAAVLNPSIAEIFDVPLKPIRELSGFDIIKTPGHTRGSICLFYRKEKILFSGDTLFFQDSHGRTDLPTSAGYDAMAESLEKLKKIDYSILCPGHDY
jgi:glyoxylase-like metal-dependent hydrolase (beta-lactamase superfamily II)